MSVCAICALCINLKSIFIPFAAGIRSFLQSIAFSKTKENFKWWLKSLEYIHALQKCFILYGYHVFFCAHFGLFFSLFCFRSINYPVCVLFNICYIWNDFCQFFDRWMNYGVWVSFLSYPDERDKTNSRCEHLHEKSKVQSISAASLVCVRTPWTYQWAEHQNIYVYTHTHHIMSLFLPPKLNLFNLKFANTAQIY